MEQVIPKCQKTLTHTATILHQSESLVKHTYAMNMKLLMCSFMMR